VARVLLALLVLTLASPSAQAAQQHRGKKGNLPDCARHGSETIYQSPRVRVYAVDRGLDEHRFACLREANRRFSIDGVSEDHSSYLHDFVERGPWLGFVDDRSTKYSEDAMYATAYNLRTGAGNVGGGYYTIVHGYGLTRRGSIAWLQSPDPDYGLPDTKAYKVVERVHGRDTVLLDSGHDIDPTSLAVGGKHVYWMKAGAAQTAPIP
jgi:hypothetical protein